MPWTQLPLLPDLEPKRFPDVQMEIDLSKHESRLLATLHQRMKARVEELEAERRGLWRLISNPKEGEMVVYLGVHAIQWKSWMGEPTVAFIQAWED